MGPQRLVVFILVATSDYTKPLFSVGALLTHLVDATGVKDPPMHRTSLTTKNYLDQMLIASSN